MKKLVIGAFALSLIAAPAFAETRYDRNLEEAVMKIVAGRIGDIRGGFSFSQAPQIVVIQDRLPAAYQDRLPTGSIPVQRPEREIAAGENDGLMPAVERRVSRVIF